MADLFWFNNPKVLFDKDHVMDFIPQGNTLASKLNSVTRLILLITIVTFAITKSVKVLISAGFTLCAIVIIYKIKRSSIVKRGLKKNIFKEGFANSQLYKNTKCKKTTDKFTNPTPTNPLMNVLLPEIGDNPDRKAAAPSFNPEVEKKINESAGNVGPDPRLFLDLGDSINFEQSMQRFYTTANTRVGNDQTAFAKFCYGEMPSCKEGDALQCTKDNGRWINY
jgi:hypothetical protein